ncbi:MAG TPA: alpha/beta hydrolase [Methylophilaceae bacterium]|nr:alpha/beta hydrolase [Methylophilaceae bacterium]
MDNTSDKTNSAGTQPWVTGFASQHTDEQVGLRVFGKAKRESTLPVIVYFHGGLFNCGNVEDAAGLARRLASEAVIVCVDYPLAPKLHFPATVEVAFEALLWTAVHAPELGGDAKRLLVAGDQAGGNLAAVVSMMARDRGLKIDHAKLKGQVLINPMLDPQQTTKSMQQADDCPCRKAWSDYLPCVSDALHPYAAPTASRRLGGLAPALIISSELDPLRDEAEQYAAKLIAAGVPVQVRRLESAKGRTVQPDHPSFEYVVQMVSQFMADAA